MRKFKRYHYPIPTNLAFAVRDSVHYPLPLVSHGSPYAPFGQKLLRAQELTSLLIPCLKSA
jgi:hypothetical protein